jgi:hypothetical protein
VTEVGAAALHSLLGGSSLVGEKVSIFRHLEFCSFKICTLPHRLATFTGFWRGMNRSRLQMFVQLGFCLRSVCIMINFCYISI